MKSSFARMPLTLVATLTCCSHSASPANRAAEDRLRELVASYDSAWQAKDSTRVEQLLAPDYAYFTTTGGVDSRAQTFRFLSDSTYHLTHVLRSDVAVTIEGSVARIASRWQGRGTYQHTPILDDQTCGQTWIWRMHRWQLFTEHCVNRPTTTR